MNSEDDGLIRDAEDVERVAKVNIRFLENNPDDVSLLRQKWLQLESRAEPNFFVSWHWIGTWLKTYALRVQVLEVVFEERVIGLGLLFVDTKRYGILNLTKCRLHHVGDKLLDQIWIEYNDFLIDKDYEDLARTAVSNYMTLSASRWDAFIMGASTESCLNKYHFDDRITVEKWRVPSFGVDLKAVRDSGKSYIDSLSRNTRYQIRRTEKKLGGAQAVLLRYAYSLEEGLDIFRKIGPLHIERWGGTQGESGFLNHHFVAFHENLIRTAWDSGGVELLALEAQGQPVAYLYNFVCGSIIYFYIGAFTGKEKSVQPGLLCHSRCIQAHMDAGRDYYDFMGGDMRYKRSLGERAEELIVYEYQTKNAFSYSMFVARKIKGMLCRN